MTTLLSTQPQLAKRTYYQQFQVIFVKMYKIAPLKCCFLNYFVEYSRLRMSMVGLMRVNSLSLEHVK